MRSISDLFSDHSGKCSDKWESYLEVYEAELLSFRCRETPISLLEIGVQDGGSLEIWQKAMPPGSSIVGIDIDPRVSLLPYQAGVEVFVADASNPAVLTALLQGKNFDIIIDDASHKSFDIITTFEKLFPALKYGGLYIIEDLACSYQPSFGGGLRRPGAAIEWLKCLVDILHVESWDGITLNEQDLHFRNHYSRLVQRVTFYESIAVVAKRLMPKLQPTRRVFTGATASHSPHIQLVANDFPLMPDQFRLTEAFARQVILEIARQRDSGLALASRVEPGLLSDQETSSDATGRPDLEIDANLEPASTTSDPKALLGEKPEIASYLDPQPSPHFVSAILGVNRPVFETASAKRSMSGASLCSGMLGINS
jgi:hypothetical protein